jgi:predicted O-methyltransferase YrrM
MSSRLDFCPVLDEIYASGKVVGRTGRVFDRSSSLSTPNNLQIIRSLMLKLRPKYTLEVGLGCGGSALTIACTHRDLAIAGAKHVCIDSDQDHLWDGAGICALERANLSELVEVREEYSWSALPSLCKEGYRFDMIYIDGSHVFDDVFIDFFYSHELLEIGGILLFDDSTNSHVAKVLGFIRRNYCPGIFELMSFAEHVDQSRSIIYRIAERLHRQQLTGFKKKQHIRLAWNSTLVAF